MSKRICALEGCDNEVVQKPMGVPKEYCCNLCAQKAWRLAHPWSERHQPKPKQCAVAGCLETFRAMGSRKYCDKHCHENKRPGPKKKCCKRYQTSEPSARQRAAFKYKKAFHSSDILQSPMGQTHKILDKILKRQTVYVGVR